ncbi:MAG: sugar phosphate isomerase/epimerase, partial [Phycisphaerae bacterium]|nr:sugar phosphate isomerase/epimerase [Phycisphaerae bacterium]
MAGIHDTTRRSFLAQTLGVGAAALTTNALAVTGAEKGSSGPDKQGEWEIGCYTRSWDQHDYRVALDAIAEAGFKHAGLMTTKSKSRLVISTETTPEEAHGVAEELKKRGLRVPSVYGGGIPVQRSTKEAVDALRKLIDNCAIVKAKTLLMGGVGNPKQQKPYYEAIKECCDYAAEKRLGITLKPHGGLNSTGPQCRQRIEEVGHKNFRLWYDPGNIYYYSDGKLNPADDA